MKRYLLLLTLIALFPVTSFAESRYWVGGCSTTAWTCSDAGPVTNWALTNGGTGNQAAPTTADDVFFSTLSGTATSTITASITIKSLDMTGSTAGIVQQQNTLTVSGGSGSVFTLVGGGKYLAYSYATTTFTGTTATTTITTGGAIMQDVTFNGASGGWQLLDSFTATTTTQTMTLTKGSLDMNGQTVSVGHFNSDNTNTRVLTMGASAITATGISYSVNQTAWVVGSGVGLTVTTNTATLTLSGANASFRSSSGGTTINWKGMSVVFSGGGTMVENITSTFKDFTITGTAVKTDNFSMTNDMTITGALALNGNGGTDNVNRLLVFGTTIGTTRTITLSGAGASLTGQNVDFRDIAVTSTGGAPATPIDLSNITGKSGDALGNSGMTLTSGQTNYWVADTGSWSDAAHHWASTSNGTAGTGRVPLPQDDATFDASSFTTTGKTVTSDMPRIGRHIDFAGSIDGWTAHSTSVGTDNPTFNPSVNFAIYGSIALTSGMVQGATQNTSIQGRGSFTIDSQGKSWGNTTIAAFGGTYTLLSAYTSSSSFNILNGTFDANGFNVTATAVSDTGNTTTRQINMGSGTWTLTSTGTVWNFNASGLTINAQSSTIAVTNTSATAKTFAGAGKTYNNVSITGGGSGAVIVTGANTFNTFTIGAPKTVQFTAATTNTFNNFICNGTAGNVITISSVTAATHTLKKTSGTVTCNFMNITNSIATGGALWYAANSANGGGNSGWIFTSAMPKGLIIERTKVKIQNGKVKIQPQ